MPRKPRRTFLVTNPNLNVFELRITREPIWLQQPKESGPAYAAFSLFRDLGLLRKRVTVQQETGKGRSLIDNWGTWWCWNKRVTAYDSHVEEERLKAFEEEGKQMGRRQAQLGMKMQGKAETVLGMLDEGEMTAADVAKLASEGVKIERLARGEKTGDEGQSITIVYGGNKPKWAPPDKVPPKEIPVEIAEETSGRD